MSEAVIKSSRFYGMHKLKVEYEERKQDDILSIDKLRFGLAHLEIPTLVLYNRAPPSLSDRSLEPGQIKVPIRLLAKLNNQQEMVEDSPVFFFAYRNYAGKLTEYQGKLGEIALKFNKLDEFKVTDVSQVPMGGLFVVKTIVVDENIYVRIRVTKINMTTKVINYWAIDEAFYGKCKYTDLFFMTDDLANLEMLAVPGVFETDPSPTQLENFDGPVKKYVVAKIKQPKFAFDFCPRKVLLI